ncbi:hypothetical protein AB0B25_21680 [Nocardia sp. NPDC049190]|uniref:hypothetical protein n=1 Tax=Nocardia sp. NPDC049190 TaxID=3155650 RepID=UPI0033F32C4F
MLLPALVSEVVANCGVLLEGLFELCCGPDRFFAIDHLGQTGNRGLQCLTVLEKLVARSPPVTLHPERAVHLLF